MTTTALFPSLAYHQITNSRTGQETRRDRRPPTWWWPISVFLPQKCSSCSLRRRRGGRGRVWSKAWYVSHLRVYIHTVLSVQGNLNLSLSPFIQSRDGVPHTVEAVKAQKPRLLLLPVLPPSPPNTSVSSSRKKRRPRPFLALKPR